MEHGEFAVRGSLVDLFPMGSERPLRIDLLDDEIDTIRPVRPGEPTLARARSRRSTCCRPARSRSTRRPSHGFRHGLARAFRGRPDALPGRTAT